MVNNTHKKGPLVSAYYFDYSYHQTRNHAKLRCFSPCFRSKSLEKQAYFSIIYSAGAH